MFASSTTEETVIQVIINIKNVYGNETIYPACDVSRTFADIAGTRTLTRETMRHIEKLGYHILIEQPQRVWAA